MAEPRFAIGVMAKAPVPGETKTRLIPALGASGAAQLQRQLTLHALRTAFSAAPGAVTLFTAGDPEHAFWAECRAQFAVGLVAQQGSHLGERMRHALQVLLEDCERAVLIGTDCAVLEAHHLTGMIATLDRARMSFIPAEDGGYVAVGAREPDAAAFGMLDWGTAKVMQQTRLALAGSGWRAGRDWHESPALWDVDRPEDLMRARREGLIAAAMP